MRRLLPGCAPPSSGRARSCCACSSFALDQGEGLRAGHALVEKLSALPAMVLVELFAQGGEAGHVHEADRSLKVLLLFHSRRRWRWMEDVAHHHLRWRVGGKQPELGGQLAILARLRHGRRLLSGGAARHRCDQQRLRERALAGAEEGLPKRLGSGGCDPQSRDAVGLELFVLLLFIIVSLPERDRQERRETYRY